jgi:hypothetical protein
LVEHEAQVESRNSSGETPMHIAVMKGNVQAMQALLQNGAKMTTKDNSDKSPISKLALAGKIFPPKSGNIFFLPPKIFPHTNNIFLPKFFC